MDAYSGWQGLGFIASLLLAGGNDGMRNIETLNPKPAVLGNSKICAYSRNSLEGVT